MRTLAAAVSATLAASLLAADDAAAQAGQARAPREGPLEEVIVTARFREELLQETPLAITAVSAVEIEQRGFTSAYEIGLAVPNTSLRPAQAAYGNTMTAYIRGIGQYDFLPEFEPGVGIYFDDVLHPVTMGSTIDLMDLERVEVLRGPQGTLFGRGSIGGAIRYISKKPQGEDVGEASVLYGDYDRVDIRASYDFAIAENVFARVTGVAKSRDGYQDVIDFACAHPDLAGTIPRQVFNRQANCKVGTQGGEDVIGARVGVASRRERGLRSHADRRLSGRQFRSTRRHAGGDRQDTGGRARPSPGSCRFRSISGAPGSPPSTACRTTSGSSRPTSIRRTPPIPIRCWVSASGRRLRSSSKGSPRKPNGSSPRTRSPN